MWTGLDLRVRMSRRVLGHGRWPATRPSRALARRLRARRSRSCACRTAPDSRAGPAEVARLAGASSLLYGGRGGDPRARPRRHGQHLAWAASAAPRTPGSSSRRGGRPPRSGGIRRCSLRFGARDGDGRGRRCKRRESSQAPDASGEAVWSPSTTLCAVNFVCELKCFGAVPREHVPPPLSVLSYTVLALRALTLTLAMIPNKFECMERCDAAALSSPTVCLKQVRDTLSAGSVGSQARAAERLARGISSNGAARSRVRSSPARQDVSCRHRSADSGPGSRRRLRPGPVGAAAGGWLRDRLGKEGVAVCDSARRRGDGRGRSPRRASARRLVVAPELTGD